MELFKLLGTIAIDGTDQANREIDGVSGKAESTASKLGKTMKKIGGYVVKAGAATAAAVGGAGVAATKLAMDYDDAFAQVSTLLTGSEADIQKYKDDIIKASNETGKSTSEMASAIYNAISAGVDQADAIKFTTEAMKLAKGGFTDATTAVDVLTTAINAYGLESGDATAIADKLITTQNLGKTTVDELASSMGKIIPTANSLGVDIDQLCAGYAVMTSNGIATAETTTYMNSMLNELGKSGSTAQKALAEYTESTMGSAKSMQELMKEGYSVDDVLGMLQESAKNSGKSIADMFGSAEAGKAATVLLDNSDKFDSALKSMGNSAGATEEAFTKMDSTLSSQFEKIKTNFTNIGIQIGEKIIPYVEKFSSKFVEHMPEIEDAIDKAVKKIDKFFEILKSEDAQKAFSTISTAFKKAWDICVSLWENVGKPVFDAIVDAIEWVCDNWETISEDISTFFQDMVDFFKDTWEDIGKPVWDAILETFQSVSDNWETISETISKYFGVMVDYWKTAWENIGKPIWEMISSAVTDLVEVFNENMPEITEFFNEAMTGIQDTWENHLKPVFEAIGKILNEDIKPAFEFVFKTIIMPLVENTFKFIGKLWTNSLKPIFDGICDFLTGVFTGDWETAFNGIGEIVTGIFNGIVDTINADIDTVKDIVSKGVEFLKEKFDFEWNLPDLKLPHLNIDGEFSLKPPSVPSFGVDWYAKAMDDPMIMNSPTAFGINKLGQVMAGGEAGSEVVSGTDTLMNMISGAVSNNNENLENKMDRLIDIIERYMPYIATNESLENLNFNVNKREFARLVNEVSG